MRIVFQLTIVAALGSKRTCGFPVRAGRSSLHREATVSAALNSGVPLALSGDSDIASQFALFTRRVLDPTIEASASPAAKKGLLNLDRIASIW